MKKINLKETAGGGRASRAEVYGLFLAAILILGGGTGAAVAVAVNASNNPQPSVEASDSPTSTPSSSDTTASDPAPTSTPSSSDTTASDPAPTSTPSSSPTTSGSNTSSNTSCQSAYWNSVRAEKQNRVNWLQSNVNMYSAGVQHNQDQLTALRNGLPTETVRIQINNNVFELSGTELEEFLEDRLKENSDPLARAQQDLDQAVAELNSVPTC
jgi:cytoskeletal protein RodZ